MMRERNVARRRWKNSANHLAYRALRNLMQETVRSAKKDYYQSALHESNPNIILKKVRHLGLIQRGLDRVEGPIRA